MALESLAQRRPVSPVATLILPRHTHTLCCLLCERHGHAQITHTPHRDLRKRHGFTAFLSKGKQDHPGARDCQNVPEHGNARTFLSMTLLNTGSTIMVECWQMFTSPRSTMMNGGKMRPEEVMRWLSELLTQARTAGIMSRSSSRL
jgi:hypothetical protein